MRRWPEEFPGIRAEGFDARGTLLYDAGCGFCVAMASLARRMARRGYGELPLGTALSRLPEAVRATAAGQMLWIDGDGCVWGGSRAVVRYLESTGRTGLAAVLRSRWVRTLAWLGYRVVARSRRCTGTGKL